MPLACDIFFLKKEKKILDALQIFMFVALCSTSVDLCAFDAFAQTKHKLSLIFPCQVFVGFIF